jgi:hypothetical protein
MFTIKNILNGMEKLFTNILKFAILNGKNNCFIIKKKGDCHGDNRQKLPKRI